MDRVSCQFEIITTDANINFISIQMYWEYFSSVIGFENINNDIINQQCDIASLSI